MTYVSRNATRRIAELNNWVIDVDKSIDNMVTHRDVYTKGNVTLVTDWQSNGLQNVWPRLIVDNQTSILQLKGNALREWLHTFNPYENFIARQYSV